MHDTGLATDPRHRDIVDRLQIAASGDAALDALVDLALQSLSALIQARGHEGIAVPRGAHWSSDLSQALTLVPPDYNYSLGERDGICWAWIQPNNDWQPGELEARHDHPGGSGLIVAKTAPLAFISAAILLYAKRLERLG
jgi:hypothetical protein